MAAATQEERDQWMTAIEDSIEENPFCRLELGNKISIYQYEFSIFTFYIYHMNILKTPFAGSSRRRRPPGDTWNSSTSRELEKIGLGLRSTVSVEFYRLRSTIESWLEIETQRPRLLPLTVIKIEKHEEGVEIVPRL